MSQKKIVILGASYSGLSVAHSLLRHAIPTLPEGAYQVVIVSPSSMTFGRPACPRAMIADDYFDQSRLFISIPKVLEQYPTGSYQFVQGTATALDHEGRSVTVERVGETIEKIDYYALVIATGHKTSSPLMGLNQDETYLKGGWAELRKALPTAKNVVVSGGGPAGVETAAELGDHFNGHAGWFKSKHTSPKMNITLVTSGSQLLPVVRESIAKNAEEMLSPLGVTVLKNTRVQSVSPEGAGTTKENLTAKTTITLDNGKTLEADLYIPCIGWTPNTSFIDKSLLESDGRVTVHDTSLRVDKAGPRVYAVGDVANYARPAIHLITASIPIVAANIKRDLLLDSEKANLAIKADKIYKDDPRETHFVPIGKSKGVGAAMGYKLPSFFVWMMKGRDYWQWTTGPLWSGSQWAKEA